MPSRIVLGTGLYGHNSGAMGFRNAKPNTPNVISIFKEAGYRTGGLMLIHGLDLGPDRKCKKHHGRYGAMLAASLPSIAQGEMA
jgi:arylsulfatase A-like enzyme